MKRISLAIVALVTTFTSMSFVNNTISTTVVSEKTQIVFIDPISNVEVKGIIENKCYGCHNTESKNKKGKKKLSFDKLDELSIYKQIGKYEGVHETVLESKMPPKKFLAKYPDKALTSNEKGVIIAWAKTKGEELAK